MRRRLSRARDKKKQDRGERMRYFVTGTDTDVGKTVVSAWLMLHLEARFAGVHYWKPVQSGVAEGPGDREVVQKLTGFGPGRFHACGYELPEPLSPHEAARRAGVRIEMARIEMPRGDGPLIVEGAGGVLVPLNEKVLMLDLIVALGLPVVVVARSTLGTINHTLLTLEALRRRRVDVAGVVLNGPHAPHNRAAIEEYGRVHVIGELPPLSPLGAATLRAIPAHWPGQP